MFHFTILGLGNNKTKRVKEAVKALEISKNWVPVIEKTVRIGMETYSYKEKAW